MKFRNVLIVILSAIVTMGSTEAKKLSEAYIKEMSKQLTDASERGDYNQFIKIAEDVIEDTDGEIQEILLKGTLYNLYQGKCGENVLSNGFPYFYKPSNENRAKCLAVLNKEKTINTLEELVEDLEEFIAANKGSQEQIVWAYTQLVYSAETLERIYSGEDSSRSERYRKIKEEYEDLRK
ncbi:hypothetical protein AP460_02920 [Actinobacillus pleuropneumoniae]|uniref:Uncharacterized protein n=3 Tax=Actinobacillus pleuropneumoniae TaxID=715 RepID=B0BSF2_ACTPJ|nr:hypothetical protein [Actinobacillus pleuropneumoniae]ABY70309.1 hypothetical protein APJL_1759 [Actinobacillus pleuropneumoniae serovar 3 str. JL03]EFL78028.1 hypothetical protein APP2_0440 [Actinobacillus pleuropneumoniae serovar 2 str. 4226]EFL81184.1 hypothetical protein APP6_1374 [Actinobacillus pleuropneumoniae serovar 6 str. Femo]KIE88898.1 hypothetical protein AP518_03034 [Actinobacillus pleuropneumoniae]KIE88953.1 hypothetical protein AP460_02920 [Actinobacillus pleuropneumoniae]